MPKESFILEDDPYIIPSNFATTITNKDVQPFISLEPGEVALVLTPQLSYLDNFNGYRVIIHVSKYMTETQLKCCVTYACNQIEKEENGVTLFLAANEADPAIIAAIKDAMTQGINFEKLCTCQWQKKELLYLSGQDKITTLKEHLQQWEVTQLKSFKIAVNGDITPCTLDSLKKNTERSVFGNFTRYTKKLLGCIEAPTRTTATSESR